MEQTMSHRILQRGSNFKPDFRNKTDGLTLLHDLNDSCTPTAFFLSSVSRNFHVSLTQDFLSNRDKKRKTDQQTLYKRNRLTEVIGRNLRLIVCFRPGTLLSSSHIKGAFQPVVSASRYFL